MSTDESRPLLSVQDCRASDTDPQLGVHEISACEFCRRLFLILYENKAPDSGKEMEISLDYEPVYFPLEVEAEVRFLRKVALVISGVGIAVLLVSVILGLLGHEFVLWGALISTVLCFGFVGFVMTRVSTLQRVLEGYYDAEPKLPDETAEEIQDVDWRDLLAAEFEVRRYEKALVDKDLRLGGKPWCYLRKGALQIPVFLYRMQDTDAERRVRQQHVVRMAAYCHLIEVQTQQPPSPYGIVLFADTFFAKVIPNNRVSQQLFLETLLDARQTVHESLAGSDPDMPGRRFCATCPKGHPVRCTAGPSPFTSNGKPLPVSRKQSMAGTEVYHSWCGDRFLECPPHDSAIELGIYES